MRRAIASIVAALLFATSAPMAYAREPGPPPPYPYWQGRGEPPPGHEVRPPPRNERWDDRRNPPPGWNSDAWHRRQNWLSRNGHDRDDHDLPAGLIVGTILGFVLGAAISDTREQEDYARARLNDPGWIAYCARKYGSFDPYSGTYLSYDGLRHYCR